MGYLLHQQVSRISEPSTVCHMSQSPPSFRPHDPYAAKMNSCCDRASHRIPKHPETQRENTPKRSFGVEIWTIWTQHTRNLMQTGVVHRFFTNLEITGWKRVNIWESKQAHAWGSWLRIPFRTSFPWPEKLQRMGSLAGRTGRNKIILPSSGHQWHSMTKILVKHHDSSSISWINHYSKKYVYITSKITNQNN